MLQTFFFKHSADEHPADLFITSCRLYMLQTLFCEHPADLTSCRPFFNPADIIGQKHAADNHAADNHPADNHSADKNTLQTKHAADEKKGLHG